MARQIIFVFCFSFVFQMVMPSVVQADIFVSKTKKTEEKAQKRGGEEPKKRSLFLTPGQRANPAPRDSRSIWLAQPELRKQYYQAKRNIDLFDPALLFAGGRAPRTAEELRLVAKMKRAPLFKAAAQERERILAQAAAAALVPASRNQPRSVIYRKSEERKTSPLDFLPKLFRRD